MAAGNPCIMSDADCLKSEFSSVSDIQPLPLNYDEFLYTLTQNVIEQPSYYKWSSEEVRKFAESRAFSKIAPTCIDLFKEQANGIH